MHTRTYTGAMYSGKVARFWVSGFGTVRAPDATAVGGTPDLLVVANPNLANFPCFFWGFLTGSQPYFSDPSRSNQMTVADGCAMLGSWEASLAVLYERDTKYSSHDNVYFPTGGSTVQG